MVADTADGADGVVGSVLAHGRYPDGPRSQPPLAAEDDLNPKRAKRGLCPTQPASECAGTLWPARPGPSGHSIAANIDADLQKVGCASRPLRSVGTFFRRRRPSSGPCARAHGPVGRVRTSRQSAVLRVSFLGSASPGVSNNPWGAQFRITGQNTGGIAKLRPKIRRNHRQTPRNFIRVCSEFLRKNNRGSDFSATGATGRK